MHLDLQLLTKVFASRCCLKDAYIFSPSPYHEALDKQDKYIVSKVLRQRTRLEACWLSYMVIIMGAEFYEGKEHCNVLH